MRINMRDWRAALLATSEVTAMPIMTYPGLALTHKRVIDMVTNANVQVECVQALAERYPAVAALSAMDLSVEAEAFGSEVRFGDNEAPTVIGKIVTDLDSAVALQVPQIGKGRTSTYLQVVEKLASKASDRPVVAGCIGPFSLAGRLMDMNAILLAVRRDPVLVHMVLEKCTQFLIGYVRMFKSLGANGIVIAEPAAGLLPPAGCECFSSQYVRRIVSAVQDDFFTVILHNCGNTAKQIDSLVSTGAQGLHLGCTVDLATVAPEIPSDMLLFGNIEPAGIFLLGTTAQVRDKVRTLLAQMQPYPNFVLSSGCDIPPGTSLENMDAFFQALGLHNKEQESFRTIALHEEERESCCSRVPSGV